MSFILHCLQSSLLKPLVQAFVVIKYVDVYLFIHEECGGGEGVRVIHVIVFAAGERGGFEVGFFFGNFTITVT